MAIEFKNLRRPFILDGATGTEMLRRGMPSGACTEQWILKHPEALLDLQRRYVAAGSQAVYAPTFGANAFALARHGLGDQVWDYNHALVELSRQAVEGKALVGGDISPCGLAMPPVDTETFDRLVAVYMEQAKALEDAGVDFFAVETQTSLAEARASVMAVKAVSDKPVFVSFVMGSTGRSLYGGDLCGILLALMDLKIDAFGLNCSGELTTMRYTLEDLGRLTRLPLIAKPNAGLPAERDGRTEYTLTPEGFASIAEPFIHAGAVLLGGCCGTNEGHIAALKAAAERAEPRPRELNMGEWYSTEYDTTNYLPPRSEEELAEQEELYGEIDEESIPYDWELCGTEVAELAVDDDFEENAEELSVKGARLLQVELNTMWEARTVLDSQFEVRTPLWVRRFGSPEIRETFLRYYNGHPKLD